MKRILKLVILNTLLLCITSLNIHANILQALDQEIFSICEQSVDVTTHLKSGIKTAKKLLLVFIAADNDLRIFAIRNLKQLFTVGSNQNLHILVHIDIRDANGTKVTRRYYVEKGHCTVLNHATNEQCMDSGDPQTLISFCQMGISNFPADEHILICWDHGTGYLDPIRQQRHRRTPASDMFRYNPKTLMLELDRSMEHALPLPGDIAYRGICWDQTTNNYITSPELDHALTVIRNTCMHGKKFSLIAFDACLMSMLEMAHLVEPHANILLGSQEAILGIGFDYERILLPFEHQALSTDEFSKHVVSTFASEHSRLTQDYALSAFNLSGTKELIQNLDSIAQLLIACLDNQVNKTVKQALQTARTLTTHFNEPSYRDLHHLYKNICSVLPKFAIKHNAHTKDVIKKLEQHLKRGCDLIEQYVLANKTGKKLPHARGLSIYFPERIHASYPPSMFAKSNNWFNFVKKYIAG